MNADSKLLGAELAALITDAIAPLKRRIAEIENKGVHYDGTWQRAIEYKRGSITTHKGCAWACVADTTRAEPDTGPDWQLMVKAR